MKNLELKQQLLFCDKYNINPNELLLLEIILIAQDSDDPEIVREYFSSREHTRGCTIELLSGLKSAGIIHKSYKIPERGTVFNPLDVPLNKTIIKDFHKYSFELGIELWNTYPMFGIVNGSTIGLRSISKKFDTPEDFYRYYGKTIRWNPETHNHIIELINWAKDNTNYICCTLANFVVDRKWLELEALRGGEIGNVNIDAIKVV